jgi:hypothetical protein
MKLNLKLALAALAVGTLTLLPAVANASNPGMHSRTRLFHDRTPHVHPRGAHSHHS